jgi:glucose/arabinose dehydrogenase
MLISTTARNVTPPLEFPQMIRLIALIFLLGASPLAALDTSSGSVNVQRMIDGLEEPWGIAILPNGDALVTERDGRFLRVTAKGRKNAISGIPKVRANGQGGLLDVMVPRDFAQSRLVYLSFSKRQAGGAGTALAVGQLSEDGTRLRGTKIIFEMASGSRGGRHFGSRIVEATDGTLFLTIGERGDRPSAQDLGSHNGTVVRINPDGSVPSDNPYVRTDGAQPHIWSYGHRNPQGAALDQNGQLWVAEHGAKGGDEVNRIRKGGIMVGLLYRMANIIQAAKSALAHKMLGWSSLKCIGTRRSHRLA